VLAVFAGTRLLLTLIGVVARAVIDPVHGRVYAWVYSQLVWLDVWGVWDTGWFLDIARGGYPPLHDAAYLASHQSVYAFFPAYPMLTRLFAPLTGDAFTAALLVANLALVVACCLLFRLVAPEHGERVARTAVLFLLLFPTGFILSSAYSESLYLALALGCFLAARARRFWAVGLLGAALAVTRNLGVLIVLPMLWLHVRGRPAGRRLGPDVLWLGLVPAALTAHVAFVYLRTGDLLAFVHAQQPWRRQFSLATPFRVLGPGLLHTDASTVLVGSLTFFFLVVLCVGARRVGFAAWLFGAYTVGIPLFGGLMSMPRFFVVVFPIAVVLALFERETTRLLVATALALTQGALMVFWATGFTLIV
jgi:hypothetical protein